MWWGPVSPGTARPLISLEFPTPSSPRYNSPPRVPFKSWLIDSARCPRGGHANASPGWLSAAKSEETKFWMLWVNITNAPVSFKCVDCVFLLDISLVFWNYLPKTLRASRSGNLLDVDLGYKKYTTLRGWYPLQTLEFSWATQFAQLSTCR